MRVPAPRAGGTRLRTQKRREGSTGSPGRGVGREGGILFFSTLAMVKGGRYEGSHHHDGVGCGWLSHELRTLHDESLMDVVE